MKCADISHCAYGKTYGERVKYVISMYIYNVYIKLYNMYLVLSGFLFLFKWLMSAARWSCLDYICV